MHTCIYISYIYTYIYTYDMYNYLYQYRYLHTGALDPGSGQGLGPPRTPPSLRALDPGSGQGLGPPRTPPDSELWILAPARV